MSARAPARSAGSAPAIARDVVAGSLAGLERGEIVCAQMLEDAGALQRLEQAELAVLGAAQVTTLASRYRST